MSNTTQYQQQVKQELKNMDHRLYELEEKITSIDTKLSQVVDAILGNSLTKTGGFVNDIDELKKKIDILEEQVKKQEEFKKSFNNICKSLYSYISCSNYHPIRRCNNIRKKTKRTHYKYSEFSTNPSS